MRLAPQSGAGRRLGPWPTAPGWPLVQQASGLEPDANRASLDRARAPRRRPGRLPRGLRPRLRRGRLRRQRRTPSRSTARSRPRSRGWPTRPRRPRWWRGCSRPADDPAGRSTRCVVRGAADGDVPQDPPLRLLRLPRVRPAHRRAARAGGRSTSAGFGGRADDLLRPAVPRAGAGAGRRRAPRCSSCRRRGWPGPRKVDHWRTLVPPGRSRTPCFVVGRRAARAALQRALAGGRPARRRPRRGRRRRRRRDRCAGAPTSERARRTNPSLANRRL